MVATLSGGKIGKETLPERPRKSKGQATQKSPQLPPNSCDELDSSLLRFRVTALPSPKIGHVKGELILDPVRRRAHLLALITAIFWSFAFVSIRQVMEQFESAGTATWNSVMAMFLVRVTVSGILFTPLLWHQRAIVRHLGRREWLLVVGVAAFGSFGYHLPLNYGAMTLQSGTVGLMTAMSPIFSAMLAFLLLRERMGPGRIAGVMLGVAGVALCLRAQGVLAWSGDGMDWQGLLAPGAMLIASMSGAAFAIVGRSLGRRVPKAVTLGLGLSLATILALPMWSAEVLRALAVLDGLGWLAMLYLAVICLWLAYWLWYQALSALDTVEVTIYLNLTTVLAILWGFLLYNERVTLVYLWGAACVISAVILVNRRPATPLPR